MMEIPLKAGLQYGEIFSFQEKEILRPFFEQYGFTVNVESVRDVDLMELCEQIALQFARSGVILTGDVGGILGKAAKAKEQMADDMETLTFNPLPVAKDERLPDYIKRYLNGRCNFPEDVRAAMAKFESASVLDNNQEMRELDTANSNDDFSSLDLWERMMASLSYFSQLDEVEGNSGSKVSGENQVMIEAWRTYYLESLIQRGVVRNKADGEIIKKLQFANATMVGNTAKA